MRDLINEMLLKAQGICFAEGEGDGGDSGGDGGGDGGGDNNGGTGNEGGGADNSGGDGGGGSSDGDGIGRGTSVLDDGSGQQSSAPQTFPDDWRGKIVEPLGLEGEKKDAVTKQLERMTDPSQLAKSYIELQSQYTKLKQDGGKVTLPENPTDEQLSEYREANNIPQTVEGYMEAMPEGMNLSEDDKLIAQSFMDAAHKMNMPKDYAGGLLQWYQGLQERAVEAMKEDNMEAKQDLRDKLVQEWGGEAKANFQKVDAILASEFPQDVVDMIMQATLPDGIQLMNKEGFVRGLAQIHNKVNPTGAHLGGQIPDTHEGVQEQIDKYRAMMRNNREGWNNDEKAQAHYRSLLDWQAANKK